MRKLFALLCLFCFAIAMQAQISVSGTVTGAEDGEPLPGAKVIEKGTSNGTLTNDNGQFNIDVAEGATLVFKYVGMEDMEMAASSSMNVSMQSSIVMDEVVVTALGIERGKKELGYAVQQVGGDEVRGSGEVNAIQGIAGKVAGVQVIGSSGAAGGASYIRIRGASSLTGNNQPLIVVDGIPLDNSQLSTGNPDDGGNNNLYNVALSNRGIDINPDDIESISVLKGPAAAALYGIQAANGCIMITTKKGSATPGKKVHVSFNTSLALDQVNKLPELQEKYAQGTGWYDFDANGNPIPTYYGPEFGWPTSWGPSIDTLRFDGAGDYPYDPRGNIVGQSDPNAGAAVPVHNNVEDFFQMGSTFQNNLALSGGNENTVYRFSIGRTDQSGIVPNNTFSRTNIKLNSQTRIWEKVTLAAAATYSNSGGTRIQQGSNTSGLMLGLLRTPRTFDNTGGFSDPVNEEGSYLLPDGSQRNYRGGGGYDSPYWTVNRTPFNDDVNRLFGMTSISYDATDWLNVFYRVGTDFYTDRRKQYFAAGSRTLPAGRMFEDQHFYRHVNSDLWVTLKKQFNEDMDGSLMLGNNIYNQYYQRLYTQGDGFVLPEFYHMSNTQSFLTRETQNRKRTTAMFFDAKFNYGNYLYLNVTGRNEWSSTLPTENRSFFYPSASASFVFTEALGMSQNKTLPFGKVRVSWAQVGNDADPYSLQTVYENATFGDGWTNGIAYPFNGTPGFTRQGVLGNPNLRPEKTNSFEVGADLRFLNNRIGLDIAYYSNVTVDQIFAVQRSSSSGYRFSIENAGKMSNKGIEAVLTATPVKSQDFQWDALVNFTMNRNEVVELAEGVENLFLGGFAGTAVRAVEGQPYGALFGGRFLRDDAGNMIIENDTNSFYYGYPIADPATGVIGNPNPDWLMGIRNTLTWKGLSFSFLFDIRKGGDIWNGTQGALTYFGMSKLTETRGETQVFEGIAGTLDGDGNIVSSGNANTVEVELNEDWYTDNGGGFGAVDEHFVQDGSWVRLRDLSLSYSFGKDLLDGTPLGSLNLGFSGRNLWLWTNYEGIDPETSLTGANNAQGMDYFNMPNTRSYIFNLGVTF